MNTLATYAPKLPMNQTPPRFAPNESAFLDALFTGPRTFDGFIRHVGKGRNAGVHFRYMSHELCANPHGVICYKDKQDDGRTRYRFTNPNEWPFDFRTTDELFETVFRPLLQS